MKIRKRGFSFNIIHTLFTKFILIFGSFLVSIVTARLIGPEGKGIIAAVFAVPSLIISFADLGIKQSATYFLARTKYSTQDVINSIFIIWIFTSIIGLLIVLIYFSVGLNHKYSWFILFIALLTIPINVLYNYLKGILQGKELIHKLNNSSIFGVFGNISLVLFFVWLLDWNVTGTVIAQLISIIISLIYTIYIINQITPIRIKYVSELPWQLFTKGISYSITLFVLQLNYRIDIVILEQFTSSHEIGLYSIGVNLAELLWTIPASIGFVLFAKSANTTSSNEAVTRSVKLFRITAPLMLIISTFFFIVVPLFISTVYGENFTESAPVTQLLLPGTLSMVAFKILHSDMAGRGKPLFAFNIFLTSLIINVILNYYLIPKYGIHGAAIASTISYLLASILYVIKYTKATKINFNQLIIKKEDLKVLKKLLEFLKIRGR